MTDGNRAPTPVVTAGLDLGDKYSYLCFIDQHRGEVMEEGRLRTTPEAFVRRFESEQQMMVAIEAGTHSPWVSRKLEECGHKVLVANPRKTRLIYGQRRKTTSQSGYRELPAKPGTYYDSKSVDWRQRSTAAPDSWYKATAALLLPRPQ